MTKKDCKNCRWSVLHNCPEDRVGGAKEDEVSKLCPSFEDKEKMKHDIW